MSLQWSEPPPWPGSYPPRPSHTYTSKAGGITYVTDTNTALLSSPWGSRWRPQPARWQRRWTGRPQAARWQGRWPGRGQGRGLGRGPGRRGQEQRRRSGGGRRTQKAASQWRPWVVESPRRLGQEDWGPWEQDKQQPWEQERQRPWEQEVHKPWGRQLVSRPRLLALRYAIF